VVVVVLLCMSTLVQGLGVGPTIDVGTPMDVPEPSYDVRDDVSGYDLGGIVGHFTENKGQLDDDILYYCVGGTLSVAFGTSEILYDYKPNDSDLGVSFRVSFPGANNVQPQGIELMEHQSNFFIATSSSGTTPMDG
jgi:hypothetical protein